MVARDNAKLCKVAVKWTKNKLLEKQNYQDWCNCQEFTTV